MEIMTTVRQDPIVAKKIYLHRNGLKGIQPKMLVVNQRNIRDFNSFLNRVTSGIKAPVAVRSIYTPIGGSRIHKLEELENGKHYVAGGNEHFKRLKYDHYRIALQRQTQRQPLVNANLKINPVPVRTVHAVSRFRNLPEKPYLIQNGDALFKGVRVLLPRRLMHSWEHVLELVTDKAELNLPAKRLCTLEGQVIHAVTDIKDGEKYVALEGARRFIKLPYSSIDPLITKQATSTNRGRTRRLTSTTVTLSTDTASVSIQQDNQPKIKRLMPIKQHKGVERPFAGHKNKAARNRALRYAQTDSAFGTEQKQLVNTSLQSEGSAGNDESLNKTHDLSNVDDTTKNDGSSEGQQLSGKPRVDTIEERDSKEIEEEVEEEVVDDTKQDPVTAVVTNDSITSEPGPPKQGEGDEVIPEEVITANEDPPVAMDINNGSGGIVEMQGQKLNETVDLSVARKDIERESSDAIVTEATPSVVPGNPTGTSRVPSKHSTKSNTPLNNASKTSLNKSKSSSKNVSRATSNHSRHDNNEDTNTTTAADDNGGNNSVVTGADDNTD